MKASLKLREEQNQNPLFRAKVPVSILGLPFVSGVTAGDSSDLQFHLRTASSSGPSLKLSYNPNNSNNPFSFSVKSGVGLFGSPDRSPLTLSAHFSLLGSLNPSFSVHISPHLGHFSLKKTAHSNPNPNPNPNSPPLKPNCGTHIDALADIPPLNGGFFSGTALSATTVLPVSNTVELRLRWGVNVPAELSRKNLPYLSAEKVSIERVEPRKKAAAAGEEGSNSMSGVGGGDVEVLKGMCLWMGREVEELRRENRFMKESMEELRSRTRREAAGPAKWSPSPKVDSNEFEQWKKKKKQQSEGADIGRRDAEAIGGGGGSGTDVGEELKRAIKAASSCS